MSGARAGGSGDSGGLRAAGCAACGEPRISHDGAHGGHFPACPARVNASVCTHPLRRMACAGGQAAAAEHRATEEDVAAAAALESLLAALRLPRSSVHGAAADGGGEEQEQSDLFAVD